jgi:hypothetical protein
VQDVERATLRILEGLALDPTQALAHRGVNETMPDVPLLATQPDPAPYLGTYRRPPFGTNTVSMQNGQLMLDRSPIAFYGADRAVVTSGNSKGNPVEFVRKPDGTIGWVSTSGGLREKISSERPPLKARTIKDIKNMNIALEKPKPFMFFTSLILFTSL